MEVYTYIYVEYTGHFYDEDVLNNGWYGFKVNGSKDGELYNITSDY